MVEFLCGRDGTWVCALIRVDEQRQLAKGLPDLLLTGCGGELEGMVGVMGGEHPFHRGSARCGRRWQAVRGFLEAGELGEEAHRTGDHAPGNGDFSTIQRQSRLSQAVFRGTAVRLHWEYICTPAVQREVSPPTSHRCADFSREGW